MYQNQQFKDVPKVCKDCGESFTVFAGEQQWLWEKFGDEFNIPVRCKPCRKLKKERAANR